jgi:hypothetical protein
VRAVVVLAVAEELQAILLLRVALAEVVGLMLLGNFWQAN